MTKKIKAIISSYDDVKNPHYGGGGATAVYEIAKRLAKIADITVVTGKYNNSNDKTADRIKYKRIGIYTSIPKLDQLIYSIFLPFYALVMNYDIWIESFTPPFSTGFLQLFTKKPVIGLVHMLAGEDMKRKYKLPFDVIEKIGLKTYKYFIVNTEHIKSKIKKFNATADIHVIGNGIEKVHKNSGKGRYALYIGRLEINQKGLDLLIDSWKNVDGKLIIAGQKGDFHKLKRLIYKNKLESKIKLVGQVSGEKKNKLFTDAAFVVVPSRFETFSMSTLEAFSYSLPVVSFDIDGLKWTPNGSVIKAHPFNTISFANACNDLFKSKTKRLKLGAIGRLYAQKYTWNKIAKGYSNIIYRYVGLVI